MIQVLLLLSGFVSGVLLPLAGIACLFSLPFQLWADRLRPRPTDARYGLRLLASLTIPLLGFAIMCALTALFFRATHRPSALILEPVVGLWLGLLFVVGVAGNAAYSAYRTWRWFQARRSAAPPRAA